MIDSADDLLIFLHLPKAGGTTLRELIGRQYTPGHYLDLRNDRQIAVDLKALTPKQRDKLQALSGHVSYGVHVQFRQPSTYFTFLRHPVDRLVSHYHYVRNNPRHFLYTAVTIPNLSLLNYVQSDLSEELTNDQTRRLAGMGLAENPTADDLLTAQRNLATHFCVAGVIERFDESLLLLSQSRSWRRPYYLARNVGAEPRQTDVTATVREAILERNQLDLILYETVRERLDEAIAARGPAFAAELARFREGNNRYQRLHGAAEDLLQPVHDMGARLRSLIRPPSTSNAA